MAGKGDIDIGINVKDEGVTAAVNAIFNGVEGAADNLNKILGREVQKKLVVESFFDASTAQKGIRVVERDVNNLGAQIEKLAEKSKKLEFGSATSLKGQIREATQARDQIKRYEEGIGLLGQRVRTVTSEWSAQNAKVQGLSRQLNIATASGFWGQLKAGFNLQGLSNFSNGLVAVTQGLQSASILIGQVTASFNQLFAALAKIQQFELSFQAIGASASETSLAFQESERIALGLGVGIQTVRDAFQQLSPVILASGGSIGDVSAITEALSSRFAAFGLNADKSRRVMNGVIQAFGKGKLMAEELTQQISEADPAFRVDLASAIGVTVAQLGEMVQAGEITSAKLIEFLPLLSKSSLLFGKLGDSGASAAAALSKGNVTITQAQTQLESLNQLSFEQLAGSLEPFLAALIRIQGAVVDFGTALSKSAALQAFGEFLGQIVNQAGAVIETIGTFASVFFSIIEAVGNVITAIDNFTQSIGGVRVVVTALAALITAKLVTALFELGATAIGAVVRAVAGLIAGAAASGTGLGGMAGAAFGAVKSFTGLNAATVKQIASNAGLIASTGGVTAALQKTGAAATEAVGKIMGAGGTNAAPWLADIGKQATTGAQGLGKLAPAVQQTIPAWVSAGGAAKAYTKGTFDAYAASVQAAGGVSKVAGAAQAGLPAFVPFTKALQGAQGAAAGLGPAAVFAAGGTAAAGTAAGAATAPTLTLSGAVTAARVAMAEAAKSAIAFAFALATNPIFLAIAAIAGLVIAGIAINNAFGGSRASIDSFKAGMEGIDKRTTEAKAAIDAAGDSATDFEERLGQLQTKADGFGAIDITIKAVNAQKQFEEIEAGVKKAFDTAKKAVEGYDAAADKSGKEGLKRAEDIKAAEEAIALAIQSTKQKRAELEQAATQGGKTATAAEKVILAAYNENVKSLEKQRDALRKLKGEASEKKIPVTIVATDATKAVIDGIESRIKQIGASVALNVDANKAKEAYYDVEALKISLNRLKNNSYKIDADVTYKVNEAVFQNALDVSKAIEDRLRSAEALAKSVSSLETAAVTARERSVTRGIDGLKESEDIRAKSAQKEIDYLRSIGASKDAIADRERQNDEAKQAAQNNIRNGENYLKGLVEEKRRIELRAAQARLDALPAIQAAERASLSAQQEITALKLEQLRLEQEQTKEALKRDRDALVRKEKNTKDPETKENLNNQIGSLNQSIENQQKLLDLTGRRLGKEKEINAEQNRSLSNTQQAQTNEAKAKVIELEGTINVNEVNTKSVDPVAVNAKVELENDPKLQKLVKDGEEADVKIVPQTKEATKKVDDFFKEVLKGPDPKLLKPLVLNTVSPDIEEVEIISNIAPPDPGPAKKVVSDLSREGVEIASAIKAPDDREVEQRISDLGQRKVEVQTSLENLDTDETYSKIDNLRNETVEIASSLKSPDSAPIKAQIRELSKERVQIETGLDTPDSKDLLDEVKQIEGDEAQIPSNILDPSLTGIDDIRRELERNPIVIPVKFDSSNGASGAAGLGVAPTEIKPVVNTDEAERKLRELGTPPPSVLPVVETPDTSKAQAAISELGERPVEIETALKPLDDSSVRGQLKDIMQTDVTVFPELGVVDASGYYKIVNAVESRDVVIPARVDLNQDEVRALYIRAADEHPLDFEARVRGTDELDRVLERVEAEFPIEFRLETQRISTELNRLRGQKEMVQLGVEAEPGALERIDSQINALGEQKRAIDIKFLEPDPERVIEWVRTGLSVPLKLETIEVENEINRLQKRQADIEIGVAIPGTGELQRIENELNGLLERRRVIQVAYSSPDPQAIDNLGKELEAKNVRLKTSFQDLDLTEIDRQLDALRQRAVPITPTIRPVSTEATKNELSSLGATRIQFKPTVAPIPTEPTKAQAAALATTPVAFNPVVKPIDTTAAKAELAAFANAGVNVPLTVNPDTVAAKAALGGIRAEGDAISASINSATTATAGLGLQAQAATSPFNLLGTATAGLQTSSSAIQGNLAGVGPAATLASQPVNRLGTALAGASTDALATATSVSKIALGGQAASTAFGEFLMSTGGISSAVGTVTTSANTLKSAFVEARTVLGLTKTTVDEISTGTSIAGQNIESAATSGEALDTAVSDSATSSGELSTALSEVSTGAGTAATNVSVVDTNLQSSVTTADNLTASLNAAAAAARSIRIPSGGNNYFAGGRVQGGAAVTVNEFGREMFLSNSGKLSRINAPAWGTWRAPSSGTIIPAHIAAGINIPRGGVKVSSPGTSFSPPSSKKGGSGLGKVVANLLSALNASQNARHSNSDAIQAAQASQIGKLSRAVDNLAKKDLNVNSDAIQAGQALEIGKLSRAVDKLAKKDWNVNVAVRGSSSTTYLDALNRSM